MQDKIAKRKKIVGTVIKISGKNTVKVSMVEKYSHNQYEKVLKTTKTFIAHVNDDMEVKVGDVVVIEASKPISKTKNWVVIKKEK